MTKRGGWGNLTALSLFGEIMLNFQNLFEIELKKLINTEIDRLKSNLAGGMGVLDYAEYKFQVGRVAGLNAVLEMCEEVRSDLSKQ